MKNALNVPYVIVTKPIGAICNLNCEYCFYLDKKKLYPDAKNFHMNIDTLEKYIKEYINQCAEEITFIWQGGEPTLLGITFFEKVLYFQGKYKGNKKILNTFQTNGLLINDDWAAFLKEYNFLIGFSLDGPEFIQNKYRKYYDGRGSFKDVMKGLKVLQKHNVDYNILTCVNRFNAKYSKDVYTFLKDESGTIYFQFIPIVEKDSENTVTEYSVNALDYGDFLKQIFNKWVERDIGKISVQIFDVVFNIYAGLGPSLCIFQESCGYALALEHNGDVYSCDHFVSPDYLLGNINKSSVKEIVYSEKQRLFGDAKKKYLPDYCVQCPVKFLCNGGCPKNRFIRTPDGQNGLNYLCEGYKNFFSYVSPYMQFIASEYKKGVHASQMMKYIRAHRYQFDI